MAHIAYIPGRGSLANWGTGTTVAPSEFWWFESNLYKCINGDDGGVWAPAIPIYIGGQGLYLTGPFETEGNLATYADTFIGSDDADALIVSATSTFNAAATFTVSLIADGSIELGLGGGSSTINIGGTSADSLSVTATSDFYSAANFLGVVTMNGNVTIGNAVGDTLTVNATPTFAENVAMSKALTVTGTLTANGNVALGSNASDAIALYGILQANSGAGGIQFTALTLDDSDHTVGPDSAIFMIQGSMSANRTLTLSHPTGGWTGSPFKFIRCDHGTYYLLVADAVSGGVIALGYGYTDKSALVYWNGTRWAFIMRSV